MLRSTLCSDLLAQSLYVACSISVAEGRRAPHLPVYNPVPILLPHPFGALIQTPRASSDLYRVLVAVRA
jgi:hypothetical protein